jgi:hypothetical protein
MHFDLWGEINIFESISTTVRANFVFKVAEIVVEIGSSLKPNPI